MLPPPPQVFHPEDHFDAFGFLARRSRVTILALVPAFSSTSTYATDFLSDPGKQETQVLFHATDFQARASRFFMTAQSRRYRLIKV